MDFVNATALPAAFSRGSTSNREMVGVVATKLTARIENGQIVRCAPEEAWPVFEAPHVVEDITLNPETDFRKQGTDILVFGQATAPQRKPTTHVRIGMRCGAVDFEVDVIGDRWWRKVGEDFMASDPQPFVTMPVTNDRAFGGVASYNGTPVPHSVNPTGRGFSVSAAEVDGKPLPNLERPATPIRSWADQPSPACLYRPHAPYIDPALLARPPVEVAAHFLEQAGNDAVPEMIAPPGQLGTEIHLRGFDAAGDVVLPLPPYAGPDVVVQLGAERSRFQTTISTVIVLVEHRVLVVTYRCVFRYLFRPGDVRTARLAWRSRAATTASR